MDVKGRVNEYRQFSSSFSLTIYATQFPPDMLVSWNHLVEAVPKCKTSLRLMEQFTRGNSLLLTTTQKVGIVITSHCADGEIWTAWSALFSSHMSK